MKLGKKNLQKELRPSNHSTAGISRILWIVLEICYLGFSNDKLFLVVSWVTYHCNWHIINFKISFRIIIFIKLKYCDCEISTFSWNSRRKEIYLWQSWILKLAMQNLSIWLKNPGWNVSVSIRQKYCDYEISRFWLISIWNLVDLRQSWILNLAI